MRVAAALMALVAAAEVRAQERVEVTIAGPVQAQEYLQAPVAELVGPLVDLVWHDRVDALDLRVVVFPPQDPQPALARVWLERGMDRVTIFLVDAPWERILVRHVPAPEGLDEAVREQVAQIVRAAIEALLGGAHIGITREEAQDTLHVEAPVEPVPIPPLPAPIEAPAPVSTPAPIRRGWTATGDAFLGYVGQLFADGPTLRHAIAIAGTLRLGDGPVRPIAVLGVDFWPTSSTLAAGIELDLRTWIVRAELGADWEVGPDTSLRASAGVGLEVTAVEPRSIGPTRVADAWDAASLLLVARAGVVQRVWEIVALTASFAIDVDPIDARYVVVGSGGDQTVLDPWIVRPALWLGAGALWR